MREQTTKIVNRRAKGLLIYIITHVLIWIYFFRQKSKNTVYTDQVVSGKITDQELHCFLLVENQWRIQRGGLYRGGGGVPTYPISLEVNRKVSHIPNW